MAAKLGASHDVLSDVHDINVTPFIDVMLVLLVIFMVTAPLTTVDVPVTLPVSDAAAKPPPDAPIFLTLQSDLSIAIGESRVSKDNVVAKVIAVTNGKRQTQLFLRADKTVSYDHLMDLLNALGKAGYLKFSLVGEPTTGTPVKASPAS